MFLLKSIPVWLRPRAKMSSGKHEEIVWPGPERNRKVEYMYVAATSQLDCAHGAFGFSCRWKNVMYGKMGTTGELIMTTST